MIISPSILASDFGNLKSEVKKVTDAGAQWVHIDVMDGHFVPNITLGPDIVKGIRNVTNALFDVHLMIDNPLFFADRFIDAGADLITFHIESGSDAAEVIKKVKSRNNLVGISVKPKTDASVLERYIDDIDLVLIMTVEPGFGGQSFMADMIPKIEAVSKMCRNHNKEMYIEVDGGISKDTAPLVLKAGANVLVAGSAIFGKSDYKEAIEAIRNC